VKKQFHYKFELLQQEILHKLIISAINLGCHQFCCNRHNFTNTHAGSLNIIEFAEATKQVTA